MKGTAAVWKAFFVRGAKVSLSDLILVGSVLINIVASKIFNSTWAVS